MCGTFEALLATSWTLVYKYTKWSVALILIQTRHIIDHLGLDAFYVLYEPSVRALAFAKNVSLVLQG